MVYLPYIEREDNETTISFSHAMFIVQTAENLETKITN